MHKLSLHKSLLGLMSLSLVACLCVSQAYAEKLDTTKTVQPIQALVSVQNAWVRPTNAGQDVGAAYMTLTSTQDITLVGIESDITKSVVEIHSMSMEGGIMKMRMLDKLPLSAGKPYILAPGGFHLMLFDLKKPLNVGDQVNFVLHFRTNDSKTNDSKSKDIKQNVKAMVQSSAGTSDVKGTAK
jgi:copper(I)-binding protein